MAYSKGEKFEKQDITLAKYAKALGHPARISILKLLLRQSVCYCGDIVHELPIAQSTVSQHLKELKNAGLIEGEIEPPKVKYCINKENYKQARAYFNNFFQ